METSSALPEERAWKRSFWSLFGVQFQDAFSDNLFKFLVIFIVSASMTGEARDQYVSVVLATFSLPFILFAMAGGFLADRFSKRTVVLGTKTFEILVMVLGTLGLVTLNVTALLVVVFLMSLQSALFSPTKYSLLPEILPESRLSWGNGILGLGTFLAIIIGGVVAGTLADRVPREDLWIVGVGLVIVSVSGLWMSRGIAHRSAANPAKRFRVNFLAEIAVNLRMIRKDRVLLIAVAGIVYFWFLGALFGEPTMLVYSQDVLKLDSAQISLLRVCLAIGIGVGSVVAGFLSGRKIEYGLVPLGSLGLAVSAALMAIPGLSTVQFGVLLALLGFSGGFYTVPLNAIIQHRPDAKDKGSVIAAQSWLTSLGVFAASGAFWMLKTGLGLEPGSIFLVGSLATFAATIVAVRAVPDSLLRLALWVLTHTLYRVRVLGRENIPATGGALFVCNHLSYADACFLIASTDRPIRFVIARDACEKRWARRMAKILRVIPLSETHSEDVASAFRIARSAVESGEVVCIFAEGQITRTGQMLPFRAGLAEIVEGLGAPIIPVHLDNAWGSIFSFEQGRFTWKLPRRFPYPITVSYGAPMAARSDAAGLRQAVQELGVEAWNERKPRMKTLQRAFVHSSRRHPRRFAMADSSGAEMGFFAAFVKVIFLARRLRRVLAGDEMVGIFLPPSSPAALINYAVLLLGKVPVNLNYTLSSEALGACMRQAGIKRVVTSDKFLKVLKLELPAEVIELEKIAAQPRLGEKVAAFSLAALCPASLLERALSGAAPRKIDDLATVIFSSGSTGDPKGVMLSHFNVATNILQLDQVLGFRKGDRFLGILPLFHSFGFTGNLALSAIAGLGVAYHTNPTEAKRVGQLVQKHRLTFLLATPTFLQFYTRGCEPKQFASLRCVLVGAEKLHQPAASAFTERFGVAPLEAYGCTECAPAVASNAPDFMTDGFRQVGTKRGTIGHPLPGVAVRIVDPESGEARALGEPGMMLVKAPNVMVGYLGDCARTDEVLQDGWYRTGDIAAMDADGFITITDRLSRFSKIGGEMVPHVKIEEHLLELAGETGQVFAVTGVPDAKRGERLVVLCRMAAERLAAVIEKLADSDLPNLWKPKRDQFMLVEQIPLLGTGKTDLRKVRELAAAAGNASVEIATAP